MKLLGCLLILCCIPAILFFGWVSFPLSHVLPGMSLRIAAHSHATAGPAWISYGAVGSLMLLVAVNAHRRDKAKELYYAGAILLLLAVAAICQVAFGDPRLLKSLADEADWNMAAAVFSTRYLPRNLGVEPTRWRYLFFDSIGDRLVSAWYFMGLGWYVGVGTSLALSCVGALRMSKRSRRRAIGITVLAVLTITALFVRRPVLGERELAAAEYAEASGRPDEAIRRYRSAITLDEWNALDLSLYERIGRIDASFRETSAPEYRVYYAEYLVQQSRVPEAITQYEELAAAGGPLGSVAAWRTVELWTNYGLRLYQGGAFGSAVEAWQRALVREPSMWLAAFYLTRGYFAVGRYQDAIRLAERSAQNVADPIFLANLYSNLGDAYTRRDEFAPAHLAYEQSYTYDYVANLRGLSSLVGP